MVRDLTSLIVVVAVIPSSRVGVAVSVIVEAWSLKRFLVVVSPIVVSSSAVIISSVVVITSSRVVIVVVIVVVVLVVVSLHLIALLSSLVSILYFR